MGMTLFARRYVVELGVDAGHLRIATLNPRRVALRIEIIQLSELRRGRHFPGRLAKGRSEVNAPWIPLRVRDRKLPYILDLQAESLNAHRLAALLPAAIEARVADPEGRS